MSAEYQIYRAGSSMARMGRPDRGDLRAVRGCRQPVGNLPADHAASQRPIGPGLARTTSDDQQDPCFGTKRRFDFGIDPSMGGSQRQAMQIDGMVGLDPPSCKPTVPAAIKRGPGQRDRRRS